MSQKFVTCSKCKKMSSFNTRFMHPIEPAEEGKSDKKVYIVSCMHCGAENRVEVYI